MIANDISGSIEAMSQTILAIHKGITARSLRRVAQRELLEKNIKIQKRKRRDTGIS
jgi:sulfur transfer complex TusBCD TusB component (DsrH family)